MPLPLFIKFAKNPGKNFNAEKQAKKMHDELNLAKRIKRESNIDRGVAKHSERKMAEETYHEAMRYIPEKFDKAIQR